MKSTIRRGIATRGTNKGDQRTIIDDEVFALLTLSHKLLAEACAVIDEAREAIASRRLVNRTTDVPFGQITLSAGVADVHAYDDARAALRAADGALLRAKEAGRNVVLKAEPSD